MTNDTFQAMELPVGQVVPSPINVRTDVGDVSELTDSIREQGILEPLVVRPTQDGKYEVIIGSRRLASARELGLSVVPVVVQHVSDADAILRSLVENLQRGDLSLEDRVQAYKRLQDIDMDRFGSTQGLARALGRNGSSIGKDFEAYEALITLRPKGIQVVHGASPASGQRRSREAIPESHATLLEQAMSAVRGRLSEERVEETYTQIARAIAPLELIQARRLLDRFKMYPEKSVAEIESMALATVERSVVLPAETARQLEQMADSVGTSDLGDTITRLVEQDPGLTREAVTTVTSPQPFQHPLLEDTRADEEDEDGGEKERLAPERPDVQHRPLRLPDAPESVQRHNKEIWNVEHLPVKADFYTIGYAGKDAEQFLALLEAVGVSTLVDVRHTPLSHYKPDFNKEKLTTLLRQRGIDYIHKADWGVPPEVRSRSVGQDSREAIWDWYGSNVLPKISNGEFGELCRETKPPLAFMCAEGDLTACHRHRLFLALEETGLRGFDL